MGSVGNRVQSAWLERVSGQTEELQIIRFLLLLNFNFKELMLSSSRFHSDRPLDTQQDGYSQKKKKTVASVDEDVEQSEP